MPRPRRLLALHVAVLATAVYPQIAAAAPSAPTTPLPDAVSTRMPEWVVPAAERVSATSAALRDALWSGSLANGLAEVFRAAGVRHEQPAAGGSGLQGLAAAVAQGIEDLGPAPTSFANAFVEAGAPGVVDVSGPSRFSSMPRPAVGAPVPARTGEVSRESAVAALRILGEIDALLAAPAPETPVAQGEVAGCDMRDQLPFLCIGGSMNNRYTQDAAILIDLGGDDTYLNSAGGAPFLPPGQAQAMPVSVNLDLGTGNDTYTATRHVDAGTIRGVVAQGAAAANAVGILVDQGGNDLYSAPAPPVAPGITGTSALVQGSASAGALTERPFGGVGALIDLGGSDRYEAYGSENPAVASAVAGQALSLVGTGLLVDRGQGNDSYLLDAGTAEVPADGPVWNRAAAGQGLGGIGGGVLADDGGTDSFRMAAAVRRSGRRDYPADQTAPIAHLNGQGIASAGPGFLLEGQGPTTYEMTVRSEGFGWNRVQGQGYSGTGGLGLLEDIGGNDRYIVRGTQEYDLDVVVDDTCVTKDVGGNKIRCPFADVNVSGYRPTITEEIQVQGFAWFGVLGILRDHSGNDAYEATAEARLDVSVHDVLSEPTKPPHLFVNGFDTPISWAQGGGNHGAGVLVDDAGSDSYTARSSNQTIASATSDHAVGEPRTVARSRIDAVWMIQQGAGAPFTETFGGLYDLGGSGDTLLAEGLNRTHTEPSPEGGFTIAEGWPHQHGNDHGALVALGSGPSIRSIPSKTTCSEGQAGVRGFGSWADCNVSSSGLTLPPSAGGGSAPNASGAAPTLTFTSDTPTAADLDTATDYTPSAPRIPVGLRLTLPGGAPVAGEPVQLWLQYKCNPTQPTQLPGAWSGAWRTDAVTGDDGIARARIPLLFTGLHVANTPACSFDWRVLGIYGGRPGAYPAQKASPLTLT